MNKSYTLSIDEKIYDKYKDHCKRNGLLLSKQVELFMKKELKKDEQE